MSEVWDKVWEKVTSPSRIYWYAEEFLEHLVKASKGDKRALFLEVGAGSGRFSEWLLKRGDRVVAVDFSRGSIRLLGTMAKKEASFHVCQADVRSLPLRDCTFSLVFSEGLLEHLKAPAEVVRELVRVTAIAGVIVLSVPNKFSFHTFGRYVVVNFFGGWWPYGYERSFSREELRHLLESVGLHGVQVEGIGLLSGVGRYMPSHMRTFLYFLYLRILGGRLGGVLNRRFGFQVVGVGWK